VDKFTAVPLQARLPSAIGDTCHSGQALVMVHNQNMSPRSTVQLFKLGLKHL